MDEQLKANITSGTVWLRLLYMVFFALCLQVARVVMWAVVVLQFFFALITGSDNSNLRQFGLSLSSFIYQALKFLTFNTDEKPFPFQDWPAAENEVLEGEVVSSSDAEPEVSVEPEPEK